MQPKRRLPVLKDVAGDGAGEPVRAPWQWVVFGALAVFVVWVPLAALTTAVLQRMAGLAGSPFARAALFAVGLAAAGFAGGYLVGRWGAGGVGIREAALAGLLAALVAAGLASGGGGIAGALVIVAVAVPAAALGGRVGLRRRTPGA